jgi:hypothetical protein
VSGEKADEGTKSPREVYALSSAASAARPLGSNLFEKVLIRAGTWIHPTKKFTVETTIERMKAWARNFGEMAAAGIRVPVPYGHSYDPRDNAGHVLGMRVDGDSLVAVLEIPRAEDAARIGTTACDVSVSLNPNFSDGSGHAYGEVIEHVAITNYPVVAGQENFKRLTASDGAAVEVIQFSLVQEESGMDKTAEQLSAELKAKDDLAAAEGEKTRLALAAKDTQLSAQAAELKKFQMAAVDVEIDGLLAKGKICASDASKDAARLLLSADGEGAARLQLSTKGADGKDVVTEMTPAAAFRQFLSQLPEGRVVQLGRLTGDGKGKSEEEEVKAQAEKNLAAAGKEAAK